LNRITAASGKQVVNELVQNPKKKQDKSTYIVGEELLDESSFEKKSSDNEQLSASSTTREKTPKPRSPSKPLPKDKRISLKKL
jgi:hypothetical protein